MRGKILIIKLSSIGDIVHAIPAVNFLKASAPKLEIDWLVFDKFAGLLENEKSINKIIRTPKKDLMSLINLARELKKEKYDYVLDLQGLIKTAIVARLIGKSVGASHPREKLAGLLYQQRLNVGDVMSSKRHVVETNIAIIKAFINDPSPHLPHSPLPLHPLPSSSLCLIPSTTWESKLWLPQYWTEIIKAHQGKIFIVGTPADMKNIQPILDLVPNSKINLITSKTLKELPEFFRTMNIIIGVDTGPLHIAAHACYGTGTQIIGLYGPTSGRRTGPYGFECISVDEITGKKASHKKLDDCMKLIEPGMVMKLLGRGK